MWPNRTLSFWDYRKKPSDDDYRQKSRMIHNNVRLRTTGSNKRNRDEDLRAAKSLTTADLPKKLRKDKYKPEGVDPR